MSDNTRRAAHAASPNSFPRDERRLQRRLEGTRRIRDEAARAAVLAEIAAEAEQARRAARGAAGVGAADHLSRVAAGQPAQGRHPRRHPRPPGRGGGRRDRLGQDHPDPEDLPGAGPGRARPDRAHPAPPDRRPHGRRADRRGAGHGRSASTVGYKVRFTDQVGDDTMIKVMTDGILLAEIQNDRMLRRYDTLIIDEAHERSLNIDFILGYLRELLPAAARPQADHHLGDHRDRSASPSTSPARTASRRR